MFVVLKGDYKDNQVFVVGRGVPKEKKPFCPPWSPSRQLRSSPSREPRVSFISTRSSRLARVAKSVFQIPSARGVLIYPFLDGSVVASFVSRYGHIYIYIHLIFVICLR